MNYLVEVHSQVCNVSPNLLGRVLNSLLDDLTTEAVQSFMQVKRFNTEGLLTVRQASWIWGFFTDIWSQAVMELTFIHKSLGYYARDTAVGIKLEDLYTQKITQAFSPASTDPEFKSAFDAMQKTLAEARRATAVQFLCFRQTKDMKDPKEKDRDKDSISTTASRSNLKEGNRARRRND